MDREVTSTKPRRGRGGRRGGARKAEEAPIRRRIMVTDSGRRVAPTFPAKDPDNSPQTQLEPFSTLLEGSGQSTQLPASQPRGNRRAMATEPDPSVSSAPPTAGEAETFEDRMRKMLLKDRSSQGSNAHSQNAPETIASSAPAKTESNAAHSTPVRRRPTQAERRRGLSNRIDLSEPVSPSNWRQAQVLELESARNLQSPSLHPAAVQASHDQNFANQQIPQYETPNSPVSPMASSQYEYHRSSMPRGGSSHHSHMSHTQRNYSRGYSVGEHEVPFHLRSQDYGHQYYTDSRNMGYHFNQFQDASAFGRPPAPDGKSLFQPGRVMRSNTVPPRQQAEYLDHLSTMSVPEMAISHEEEEEFFSLRLRLLEIVANTLRNCEDTKLIPVGSVKLESFGSLASGFAMANSDMDLMLFFDGESLTEEQSKCIPRLIEKALLEEAHGARLLTRTRVPIIRFCSSPSADLLKALRQEREKWEQEKDKIEEDKDRSSGQEENGIEQVEKAEKESSNSIKTKVDDRANSSATSPTTAVEQVQKKREEDKTEAEAQKDDPDAELPYHDDKERIELYQIAIKEDWYSVEERVVIKNFEEALSKAANNDNTEDEELAAARAALGSLPNILSRYREPRKRNRELEFPEQSGLLCDINFSTGRHANPLGVHNTRMLRCYSLFDPRIKMMVVFVKAWAKSRNINKPYHGTLSSYGYVLMVLHYAVNVASPPLAPNLQLLHHRNAFTQYNAPETCGGYDIRFWQDPRAIRQAAQNEYHLNTQSLGSLLAGFFRYYAVHEFRGQRGFEWMKDVLSLRTQGGLLTKQDKSWTGKWTQTSETEVVDTKPREITHRYLIAIEDPFEHSHNVGRPVMHHGIVAIRDEFRRANQIIMAAGMLNGEQVNFFEPGAEHEREHRFFGPNPKHKKEKLPVFGPKNLVGEERERALRKAAEASMENNTKSSEQSNKQSPKSTDADLGAEANPEAHKKKRPYRRRPSKTKPDQKSDPKEKQTAMN